MKSITSPSPNEIVYCDVSEDILQAFSETIEFSHLFKACTINTCIDLCSSAKDFGVNVVTAWVFTDYIHLSVFSGKTHYNALLGRFVVTYNCNSGQFNCGCCLQKVLCSHKALSLCFLHKNGLLVEVDISQKTKQPTSNQGHPEPGHSVEALSNPELDVKLGCQYLRNNKRYDGKFLELSGIVNIVTVPKTFVPVEETCFYCHKKLTIAKLSSRNAKLVSLTGVHKGYKSYVKVCNSCKIQYRYQEGCHGVHNFDNNLFFTFDFCLYLREHVQQNNSVNSFVEAFNNLFNVVLNANKISKAFLFFEVLATKQACFRCSICGNHPWLPVADVNRKIAFKCSMD